MSDEMRGVLLQPTDDQRRLVRALAGFGIPHDDIAKQVGCEPKTLRKHFRDELDRGAVEATAKVAQSLFHMATTGKNVAAAIFWMKCRGGWREKSEVHHSGEVAQPYVIYTGVPRRNALSDAELEQGAPREGDEVDAEDDEADGPSQHRPRAVLVVPEELSLDDWIAAGEEERRDAAAGSGGRIPPA